MDIARRDNYNYGSNSKNPVYCDEIITFSQSTSIDRLRFSFLTRDIGVVLNHFHSSCKYNKTIKKDGKLIHEYLQDKALIQVVQWRKDSFYSSVFVHDPDIGVQGKIMQLTDVIPVNLTLVEVAFDLIPDNLFDLYDLRRVLTEGIVLRHSRAGCYVNFSGLEYRGTEYIGNKGVVRKGSKGLRIYNKQQNGRHFLRMELQFNRDYIKRKSITLPVDPASFDLFDFVDYREPLDEDKLLDVLRKKWRTPIKRAAHVEMLRSLEFSGIYSWILTQITFYRLRPVCEQIGQFKQHLKRDNLAHRVNEFFPKSGKKAMIVEGVQNGFVRRDISTKVWAA